MSFKNDAQRRAVMAQYNQPKSWHTKKEKAIISNRGGEVHQGYGYDGTIDGRPVEVRCVKRDSRYRIQEDVHKDLLKRDGSYLFNDGHKTTKLSAREVDEKLGDGKWYRDRDYPHKFLNADEV